MTAITLYIAPGAGDEPSQARVYAREGKWAARESYNNNPDAWEEVGLMNFEGKLVCLVAPREVWDQLKKDEPLMAGLQITYERNDDAATT